jgi:hypothetical protein
MTMEAPGAAVAELGKKVWNNPVVLWHKGATGLGSQFGAFGGRGDHALSGQNLSAALWCSALSENCKCTSILCAAIQTKRSITETIL